MFVQDKDLLLKPVKGRKIKVNIPQCAQECVISNKVNVFGLGLILS